MAAHAQSLDELADHGMLRIAAAVGVFDGVHLGHQKILSELTAMSARLGAQPVAVTFDPHPRQVLLPEKPLSLLQSPQAKISSLAAAGAKAVVTFPFTPAFARLPPREFLTSFLNPTRVKLMGVCVGSKWRFGAGGEGDEALLHQFAARHGFQYKAVEEVVLNGNIVSSTAIRRAVAGGDFDAAAAMLGRRYSVAGIVVHGARIAQKVLGCATANIAVEHAVFPPCGVYAGHVIHEGRRYKAVIPLGFAPTFHPEGKAALKFEAHLFDFSGDLYGAELEVEFSALVRPERKFPSIEALRAQVDIDLTDARRLLGQ